MGKARAFPADGGCTCRFIRYRLLKSPMFVHCCHCTWCQRESGSAFALNALIETNQVELLSGETEEVSTPSNSGRGQKILRCPKCRIAVWSHYAGAGGVAAFVRVGSLDDPNICPPDIHIFTESRQSWVQLAVGARVVSQYYDRRREWPESSRSRHQEMMAGKNG